MGLVDLLAIDRCSFDQAQLENLLHRREAVVSELPRETDQRGGLHASLACDLGDGSQGKSVWVLERRPGEALQVRAQEVVTRADAGPQRVERLRSVRHP